MDRNNPFPTCYAGHSTKTPINSESVIRLEEKKTSVISTEYSIEF